MPINTFWIVSHLALWLLVILLLVAVFLLYRYIGESLQRQEKRLIQGPEINKVAGLALTTVDGLSYELGSQDRAHLVLFAAPKCGFCTKARTILSSLVKVYDRSLRIVVVFRGDSESAREYVRDMPGAVAVSDNDGEFFRLWKIAGTPYVVVTNPNGTIVKKGIASSQEYLESLFKMPLESTN